MRNMQTILKEKYLIPTILKTLIFFLLCAPQLKMKKKKKIIYQHILIYLHCNHFHTFFLSKIRYTNITSLKYRK